MARTKQEVRNFLDSLIGQSVNAQSGVFQGQCVSLIKALLDFLGAPNPYSGRGNAKDVGNTLLSQGLAQNSLGWLNVCINKDMGNIYEPSLGRYVNYGHIWLDLKDEVNYEQNGARALRTTKNTRPIQQAQQIVNLDQYIIEENQMRVGQQIGYDVLNRLHHQIVGNWDMTKAYWDSIQGKDFASLMLEWSNHPDAQRAIDEQVVGENALRDRWDLQIYSLQDQLKAANANLAAVQEQLKNLGSRPTKEELADLQKKVDAAVKQATDAQANYDKVKADYDKIKAEQTKNEETVKSVTQIIGEFIKKYFTKG